MADDRGIAFALFAPHNTWVNLMGSWNQWEPTPMSRADNGWWTFELQLPDGEYEYKFETESNSFFAKGRRVAVADPRAARISRDGYENAVVRVRDGGRVSSGYVWQHDDVILPQNQDLVIYEMHIGDFRGGPGDEEAGKGTFLTVAEKLDYLRDLGVNALEIMPVTEFPGDTGWGYMPRSLFAVENSYGDPADLCRLVDECHARGIRVILDGVHNHADPSHPLAQIDHGYWFHDVNPDQPDAQFGPKFDYGKFDAALGVWPAREYVRDAMLYWIDEFHIDGIRFDATAIIGDYGVLSWFRQVIRDHLAGLKPFFAIAEHVPEDPSVAGADGPLDAAWHELFSIQMGATLGGRVTGDRPPFDLDGLIEVLNPRAQNYQSAFNVVNYLDNHDHDRIMWTLGKANILDENAFRRLRLGAGVVLTAPGIPMIWMGQEFGESREKSLDSRPLTWSLLDNPSNSGLLAYYTRLNALRAEFQALRSDTFEVVFRDDERALLVWKRWSKPDGQVVVLVNFRDEPAEGLEVSGWPADGNWQERVYGYDLQVERGILRDSLGPSEVKIYVEKA